MYTALSANLSIEMQFGDTKRQYHDTKKGNTRGGKPSTNPTGPQQSHNKQQVMNRTARKETNNNTIAKSCFINKTHNTISRRIIKLFFITAHVLFITFAK